MPKTNFPDPEGAPTDGMGRAYKIAEELLKERLRETDPDAADEMENIQEADILVVGGQYDHIESVLRHAGTPFTFVEPRMLEEAKLRPDQVMFVNCPGQIPPKGLRKIATFVQEGGFLFTTDWALKHVVEPAFPGYLEYNQKPTADEVVRVEILAADDPYLKALIGPDDDPQWWLEGSSYPIRILEPDKVEVLITSKEIADRYGESPVFVTFEHGEGKVYHMISHFYLQRTETRNERHQSMGTEYLKSKGVSEEGLEKYKAMGSDSSLLGEVESAYVSSSVIRRIVHEKRSRIRGSKKK